MDLKVVGWSPTSDQRFLILPKIAYNDGKHVSISFLSKNTPPPIFLPSAKSGRLVV